MYQLMMIPDTLFLVWIIALWLACSAFCGYLAEEKNYCWQCWFGLGLVFGPIALLAIAGLPNRFVVRVTSITEPDETNSEYKALGFKKNKTGYSFVAAGVIVVVFAGAYFFR